MKTLDSLLSTPLIILGMAIEFVVGSVSVGRYLYRQWLHS